VTRLPELRRRSAQRELLDEGTLSSRDVAANLRDIARLNRLPGGRDASIGAVTALLPEARGTVVDVGTGGADIPRALVRRHLAIVVTAVERDPVIAALAVRWSRGLPGVRVLEADGLALPVEDAAFDVAHASLLVHHLDPPEVVMLFHELQRVSRRGVVVNDFRRGWFPYVATLATVHAFARSPITRHDGPLSSRRSYTLAELDDLAADAGLRPVRRSPAILPRVVTTYR
jgi:ubiquinone/menaquinone biosynthesis C-methylase UbiE